MKRMVTPLLAFLLVHSALAGDDPVDGIVRRLTITKDGKPVASSMAGVQYDHKPAPKSLWLHLAAKTVFNTQLNIFSKEGMLARPETGVTQTLEGRISVQLGLPGKDAYDEVVLKRLTVTYVGEYLYAQKWTVTKWSISAQELARIRKVWEAGRAKEKAGMAPAKSPEKKRIPNSLAAKLGTSHVRPLYHLTDQDILNEGADQVLKLGMKVIKVWFVNGGETPSRMYPNNSKWPKADSLVAAAKLPYYKTLFAKPFSTVILNVTSMGRGSYYWRKGITKAQEEDETKQFYELAKHFLTTYRKSGKTFVLQHHEGDWHVRGHTRRNEDPDPKALKNMIKWLNARQAGVTRARKEVGQNGVFVYHAAEINLVRPSMESGKPNMVNKVLPFTNLDLVSYSAYDSTVGLHDKPEVFRKALDYIAKHLPDSPHFGNKNVYLGEFGLPENNFPPDQVQKVISNTTKTALDWGCPYVVYWQLYCNEPAKKPVDKSRLPFKRNKDCRGFWLIRPDGTPSWAWNYFAGLLKKSNGTQIATPEATPSKKKDGEESGPK